MSSRRTLKAAQAIREVVSMAILTEMRDPRVEGVTVTGVEVTPDMRGAKIRVSVMGDENKQKLCLRGLQNAAGFLQAKIGDRIDTRYIPRLKFELDMGVKKSIAITKMLNEVLPTEGDDAEQDAQGNIEGNIEGDNAAHPVAEESLEPEESDPAPPLPPSEEESNSDDQSARP